MPYIKTTTNVTIPAEKMESMKSQLGKDAALIGKNESWLMVDFCDNNPLYFRGSNEPAAMVSVDLYGGASVDAYQKMTHAITKLLGDQLSIPAERVFVKYQTYEHWGWNGSNF